MNNIEEMLNYLELSGKVKINLGLDRVRKILESFGNPERKLKIIHVGGTNGKGSTCAYISEFLQRKGYKVGLYTSPYLEEFNERIQINRVNISDRDLLFYFEKVKKEIEKLKELGLEEPTEFEIITVLAYLYFADEEVDFLVLEVGLGGEFDATNTCDSIMSVFASISIDHIDYLGDNIENITTTKSKIIKENTLVVAYNQSENILSILEKEANIKKSKFYIAQNQNYKLNYSNVFTQNFDFELFGEKYSDISLSMRGEHQIKNFITAMTALYILSENKIIDSISKEDIKFVAKNTNWQGRIEIISENPITIVDGAHNLDGASTLGEFIGKNLAGNDITIVIGMLRDKDIDGVLAILSKYTKKFITINIDNPRAEKAEIIAQKIKNINKDAQIKICPDIKYAIEFAKKEVKTGVLIYAGSLYIIGEIKKIYKANI